MGGGGGLGRGIFGGGSKKTSGDGPSAPAPAPAPSKPAPAPLKRSEEQATQPKAPGKQATDTLLGEGTLEQAGHLSNVATAGALTGVEELFPGTKNTIGLVKQGIDTSDPRVKATYEQKAIDQPQQAVSPVAKAPAPTPIEDALAERNRNRAGQVLTGSRSPYKITRRTLLGV